MGLWSLRTAARPLCRLLAASVRARYNLGRPSGILLLTGTVLDPFVYAGIIYFVLSIVFERSGFDRFQILLIGIISFRWTFSSLLDSANYRELAARFGEIIRWPTAAAVTGILAAPTLVFVLSLAAAIVFSLLWNAPAQSFDALPWVALVILVQGIWTAVLIRLADRLKAYGVLSTETPIVVVAGLLWIMSPVMYQFEEIPEALNAPFTTFNPVSHILAAYQNAYWFGLPVSLEVLPLAGVVGVGLFLFLRGRKPHAPPIAPLVNPHPGANRTPLLLVTTRNDAPDAYIATRAAEAEASLFRPWHGQTRNLRGEDMAMLIAAVVAPDLKSASAAVAEMRAVSGLDRLFEDDLAIYPDWALSQIAFAAAIVFPRRRMMLDGLLDGCEPVFVRRVWRRIEDEAARGGEMIVVTYRLLQLPKSATGRFEVVKTGRVTRTGRIEGELEGVYEAFLEKGELPDEAP